MISKRLISDISSRTRAKKRTVLFDKYMVQAPNYYCRRIVTNGSLPNHPEVRYSVVFSVEGKRVKYDSNPMLRRPGYNAPEGAYTIQERYGLWLCKDFIPVKGKTSGLRRRVRSSLRCMPFLTARP